MRPAHQISRQLIAMLAALLLMLSSIPVQRSSTLMAFSTTNTIGNSFNSYSHQAITELAIKEIDNEFFSITNLTNPMNKAIQNMVDANVAVDDDQFHSAKHFDGESFPEGQTRLINLFNATRAALGREDVKKAREYVGMALHSIQDFYTHSNWIELGNLTPHQGLARPGNTISRLAANVKTCKGCLACASGGCSDNILTSSLTSGYYSSVTSGDEDRVKPDDKCSHGGPSDTSSNIFDGLGGINKDFTGCGLSPHNQFHGEAAGVAFLATKQFIRDIRDRVTPRQIRLLLGVGPTLAISIDTTSSMTNILASVKRQAINVINRRAGTDQEPLRYILSPFNDPNVGPLTDTTDANTFKAAINGLTATNGGDCPELGFTGIYNAVAAADPGSDLFFFTDASSKDTQLRRPAALLAQKKGIRFLGVIYGDCNGVPAPPGADAPSSSSELPPDYSLFAKEVGGQVLVPSPSELDSSAGLMDIFINTHAVNLLSISDDTTSGANKAYTLPVDSTLSRVNFFLTIEGSAGYLLQRPDGSAVQQGDPGVNIVSPGGGIVISIDNPATGTWSFTVNTASPFALTVSGESTLNLSSFRFVAPSGPPQHGGHSPITGLPLAGQTSLADAVLTDGYSTAQFEFRSRNGEVLQTFSLSKLPDLASQFSGLPNQVANEFFGSVNLPNAPFQVYVTGQDTNGKTYQRLLLGLIQPQSVSINAPTGKELIKGQSATYVFQVKNLGAANTFKLTGIDDKNFLQDISPANITLNTNETKNVLVHLMPPSDAAPDTADTLTVTVESTGSPAGVNDSAVVTSTVSSATDTITGSVTDASGNAVGNVMLNLTGPEEAATLTDASGTYLFGGLDSGITLTTGGTYTVTPSSPGYSFAPASRTVSNLSGNQSASFTATPLTAQFSNASYSVGEGDGSIQISVTRSGDTTHAANVDYSTGNGTAQDRTDYTISANTLRFAAGEASKTFTVLITDDNYVEGNETLNLTLSNPTGAFTGAPSTATLTITDNDTQPPTINSIDESQFFVRQHYYDFLNRLPDDGGLGYWSSQITQCGTDQTCIRAKRIDVSNAFFYEQEFQETGAFVYRVYQAAFGQRPTYAQFMPDRSRVIGGSQLDQSKTDLTNEFVLRAAFTALYPLTQTPEQYIDALNVNTGNSLTQAERDALVNGLKNGTETRGSALRQVADNQTFIDRVYNISFVLTQYFGYLRRDPDQGGFDFWLGQVNRFPIRDVGAQHAMVCSFITSQEYQERFSSIVTHSNQECPQ